MWTSASGLYIGGGGTAVPPIDEDSGGVAARAVEGDDSGITLTLLRTRRFADGRDRHQTRGSHLGHDGRSGVRCGGAEDVCERWQPERQLDDGGGGIAGVDVEHLACGENRVVVPHHLDDVTAGVDILEREEPGLIGHLRADDASVSHVAETDRHVGELAVRRVEGVALNRAEGISADSLEPWVRSDARDETAGGRRRGGRLLSAYVQCPHKNCDSDADPTDDVHRSPLVYRRIGSWGLVAARRLYMTIKLSSVK